MSKKKSKCIYQPTILCRRKAHCRNCQWKVGAIKVNGGQYEHPVLQVLR